MTSAAEIRNHWKTKIASEFSIKLCDFKMGKSLGRKQLASVLRISVRTVADLLVGKYKSYKIMERIVKIAKESWPVEDTKLLNLYYFAKELGIPIPEPKPIPELELKSEPEPIPIVIPYRSWTSNLPPSALLAPDCRVVPFHFRTKEQKDYLEWAQADKHFSARVMTGAGGLGKTRLALWICEELAKLEWVSGFVNFRLHPLSLEQWGTILRGHKPVFIVLDYAADYWELVLPHLHRALTGKVNAPKVRFLLIERYAGDWWERFKSEGAGIGELARSRSFDRLPLQPLTITVEERKESYSKSLEAFADKLNKPVPTKVPKDLPDPCYNQILFLHMVALTYIDGIVPRGEDGIFEAILNRERRFWRNHLRSHQLPVRYVSILKTAMAAVTLARGIKTQQEGLDLLKALPMLNGHTSDVVNSINQALHECYPGQLWIEPLLPDIVGEYLCDVALNGDPELKQAMFSRYRPSLAF